MSPQPSAHSRQTSLQYPNNNASQVSSPNMAATSPAMSTHSNISTGKKPKLRVQIPESEQQQTSKHRHQSSVSSTTSSIKEETVSQQPPSQPTQQVYRQTEPGPPSALPSQFAQSLPSPSSFYPEFYQQNEIPSPLNFSNTPVTAHHGQGGPNNAFHWPLPSTTPGQQRDYRPSPLKPEL